MTTDVADSPGVAFADYQLELYLAGVDGARPPVPLAPDELERRALAAAGERTAARLAGGAGTRATLRANRQAFERWRIVPRVMRDVARRDLSVEICGTRMPAPLLLAPIAAQSVIHRDAEIATARAAAAAGVPAIMATHASTTIEDFARANGAAPRWFQYYWPRDERLGASLLERAEAAGFAAIVVTLGSRLPAWRPGEIQLAEHPFANGDGLQNVFADPVFRAGLVRPPEEDVRAAVLHWLDVSVDPTVTWDRLAALRDATSLPIVAKGILHPADARAAVQCGVDAIIVSNYGGRTIDGAVATLEMLPEVVAAVPAAFPVLLDGGVRCAADAFKALALGARAVAVGRSYAHALALAGEHGVLTFLRGFLAELDVTVGLAGYTRIDEIGPEALRAAG